MNTSYSEQALEIPVTVVIPSYNRAIPLRRAIMSVLNQYPMAPQRILVINDGSTDNTNDVLEEFEVDCISIEENVGPGPARNRGLMSTETEWVAFLDSDDTWLPTHLFTLWHHVKNADVICSRARMYDDENGFVRRTGLAIRRPRTLTHPAQVTLPENAVTTSALMAKTKVLTSIGGFRDMKRAQDLDCWIRLLEHTSILLIPDVTVNYTPGKPSNRNKRDSDAALQVLRGFENKKWWHEGIYDRYVTTQHWDQLRSDLRDGKRRQALGHGLQILRSPDRWLHLLSVLLNRFFNRSRKVA